MANVNSVIDEALCFLFHNFSKVTVSELKAVTVNFYNDEELVNSKEILLKATKDALRGDDDGGIPRMAKRQGINKKNAVVDDIFTLMSIADERNLFSAFPCFVARDLSRIPSLSTDSVNTLSLMKKVEEMEIRLRSVETSVSTQSYLQTISSVSNLPPLPPDHADSDTGAATVEDTDQTDSSGQWSVVTSRYRPPPQARKSQPLQARAEQKRKPHKKLFGVADADSGAVKSGVQIVHKSIVHVDNLHSDCTPALLREYLLSKDIDVISCYSAKSWLKGDDKDNVTAFRVCVHAAQRNAIMDPSIWSKGIILRDWKFKAKTTAQNGALAQNGR